MLLRRVDLARIILKLKYCTELGEDMLVICPSHLWVGLPALP